jgi:hypothetical protein
MADDAAKRGWLARVLGTNGATSGTAREGPLLPLWLDAKEAVDAQLARLQQTLHGFGDPGLDRIAEFGLNGITGKSSVGLMVALREADAPGADHGARRRLADAIQNYRGFLADDTLVALIDTNPFGVLPGLKATLGGALDTLARSIAA